MLPALDPRSKLGGGSPSAASAARAIARLITRKETLERRRSYSFDLVHATRLLIAGFDGYLSRHCGVRTFSIEPRCILRLATVATSSAVRLPDSTLIGAGELIVDLHLWNEHIPRVPPSGPNLAWGRSVYERLDLSMRELARAMRVDPELLQARACRAQTNFTGPGCSTEALTRLVERCGFEDVDEGPIPMLSRVHDSLENLLIAALVWTYNPRALCRRKLRRVRRPVWISRERLLARYPDV